VRLWNKRIRINPSFSVVLLSMVFLSMVVIATPLYVVSMLNEDDLMRYMGIAFYLLGTLLFIFYVASSRMHRVFRLILVGMLTMGIVATPMYLFAEKEQNTKIKNFSIFVYGIGFAIALSSTIVSMQVDRAVKCKKKYMRIKSYHGIDHLI